MKNIGRIGFVIRGDYSPAETYDFLDIVYYGGSSYAAKTKTTGNQPEEDNEFWHIFAKGGVGSGLISDTDYATTEKAGIVKPDGKTIKVGNEGEIVGAASGFTGTQLEFEAALAAGEVEVGTIVNITDDYEKGRGGVTGVKGGAEAEYRKGDVNITKEDIGLGEVGNYKSVSVISSQGLSEEEKKNARDNMGAGVPFPFVNNAAAHNGVYRGKDLTGLGIDGICAPITDGTFEDRYVGDYFDITIAGELGDEVVRCILAGFDIYLNTGNSAFTSHHAVIVTKNCIAARHRMNPTATSEGGFSGSEMWTVVIPIYNTKFGDVLGSHLLSRRTLLTNHMTSTLNSAAGVGLLGASDGCAWKDAKVSFLSEIEIFGCSTQSSSFFDFGEQKTKLPLFSLDISSILCGAGGVNSLSGTGVNYWTKCVHSATSFCVVFGSGEDAALDANSTSAYIRPTFCIG